MYFITTTNGRRRVVGLKFGQFAAAVNILKENRQYLDLSSVELDGSHTPAKNGGDAVGYQGRKACNTTNSLLMSDNQGVMLAMSTP